MSASAPAGVRYQALDALRGICALCVAAFHFAAVTNIDPGPFVRGGWLFVDFFFVLSGFVIANAYGDKLASGYSARDFMLLRLGRVYPLHLALLLAFLALELVSIPASSAGLIARQPFAGSTSPDAFVGSLAMMHTFGLWPDLVWNAPSWSIAAELWAYLTFALVCGVVRRRAVVAIGLIAALCAGWLVADGAPWLNLTFDGSLVRCLYGFGIGVVTLRCWHHTAPRTIGGGVASALELTVMAGAIAFVSLAAGPATLLAPLVFGIAVLVFAGERGVVSRMLRRAPFQWVGLLSYAIYMVHVFVLGRLSDAYLVLERTTDLRLLAPCQLTAGNQCFAGQPAHVAATAALFLAVLLPAAWVLWRFVEEPGRLWSRSLVKRMADRRAADVADRHSAF